MKRFLLAAGLLLSVGGAALAGAVAVGLAPKASFEQIAGWAFGSGDSEKGNTGTQFDPDRFMELCSRLSNNDLSECIKDAVLAAATEGSYHALSNVIGHYERKDVSIRGACHRAFHEVGEDVINIYMNKYDSPLPRTAAAAQALSDLDTDICGGALAHGIAEAYVNRVNDSSGWELLMSACTSLIEKQSGKNIGCAHGIGHALVNSRIMTLTYSATTSTPASAQASFVLSPRDVTDLLGMCSSLTDGYNTAGAECAFGVMMQVYAPIGEKYVALADPKALVVACDGFPDRINIGCFRGAGYALGNQLYDVEVTQHLLNETLRACGPEPLHVIDDPYDLSAVFGCKAQVLNHLAGSLREKPASYHADICAVTSDLFGKGVALRCLIETAQSVNESRFDKVVAASGTLGQEAASKRAERRTINKISP
jgi:hypothetical protein